MFAALFNGALKMYLQETAKFWLNRCWLPDYSTRAVGKKEGVLLALTELRSMFGKVDPEEESGRYTAFLARVILNRNIPVVIAETKSKIRGQNAHEVPPSSSTDVLAHPASQHLSHNHRTHPRPKITRIVTTTSRLACQFATTRGFSRLGYITKSTMHHSCLQMPADACRVA